MKLLGDTGARRLFLVIAFSALTSLLLIALFIFKEGVPFMLRVGVGRFLLSSEWNPQAGEFGIYPMIVASVWVTVGAMVVGAPLGVGGAIFLNEFLPRPFLKVIKPCVELLAGIPSVVYGFIGVMVVAPFIRQHFGGGWVVGAGRVADPRAHDPADGDQHFE